MEGCVFCQIARGERAADGVMFSPSGEMVSFLPLHPVVPGHRLVIPVRHVRDALEFPAVTGYVMQWAARLAEPPCNLMTAVGSEATQSVFHLHIHVVPRRLGDGLMLPWSVQQAREAEARGRLEAGLA